MLSWTDACSPPQYGMRSSRGTLKQRQHTVGIRQIPCEEREMRNVALYRESPSWQLFLETFSDLFGRTRPAWSGLEESSGRCAETCDLERGNGLALNLLYSDWESELVFEIRRA